MKRIKQMTRDREQKRKKWLSGSVGVVSVVGTLILAFSFLVVGGASAGQIPCDPATCGWSISVNGNEMMSGGYDIDVDGNLSLPNPVGMSNENFGFSIDSLGGNVDPEIIFGLGATNTSGAPVTFSFAFNLPLGGLSGLIDTSSELGHTLTAASGGSGINLFPTSGTGFIVDSQDIRFSPFSSIDKQVDIGGSQFSAAGSTTVGIETATGQILLSGGGYDLMSVIVSFGLDSNGGVGLSGRVTQTIVPEPGTAMLIGLGLLALAMRSRRSL
jgi:hypothetical protein